MEIQWTLKPKRVTIRKRQGGELIWSFSSENEDILVRLCNKVASNLEGRSGISKRAGSSSLGANVATHQG